MGVRKIVSPFLTTEMMQIRVLNKTRAKQLIKMREIHLNKKRANKRDFATNKISYITNFKSYLKNIPTP